MTFKREIGRNYYFCDTPVENIFIDEYMPDAPGEYVKVYIYAYMYSDLKQVMTNEILAKRLDMNIEDVLAAWTYWESLGIIRKYYLNPDDETHYEVEFVNIKNAVYNNGSSSKDKSSKGGSESKMSSALNDEALTNLYKEIESITGKMFDPTNALKIAELVDEDGADPSVIAFAYRYCKENKKPTDFKYVSVVIRKWLEKNMSTVKEIKDYLDQNDARAAEHRQIIKALGLNFSSVTEDERREFNKWIDEMDFNLAYILEICTKASGMNNKFAYVRKVLESEYEKQGNVSLPKTRTLNDRQRYYEQIRYENSIKTKNRREEVLAKIPQIAKLEEEIRSMGMEIGKIMLQNASNKVEAMGLIKEKINEKQQKKTDLLLENGFDADYMEEIYNCYRCNDTGLLDNGGHCSCYRISE